MEDAGGPDSTNPHRGDTWYSWPSKRVEPVNLLDDEGRTRRVRIPLMDLEGLITPTELHCVVQHFDIPEVVPADQWTLTIDGEVRNPVLLTDSEPIRQLRQRDMLSRHRQSGA